MPNKVYLDVGGSKGFTYTQSLQARIDSGYGKSSSRTALNKIIRARKNLDKDENHKYVGLTPNESAEVHESLEGIFSDSYVDVHLPTGVTLGWEPRDPYVHEHRSGMFKTPYPKSGEEED